LRKDVAAIARRAAFDLNAMQMFDVEQDGEIAVAAGIPTYMGVFGRDLLASAWQSGLLGPELALGTLRVLKQHQASEVNEWRDAEPGRIVHEIHTDPLSVLNFRPKSIYFGSVSGSFLYPILLTELWHWCGDFDMIRPFVEPAIRALKWADAHSLDETGFYRYQTKSKQGMKNQGWKDSEDAIVYPDGSQVATPMVLVKCKHSPMQPNASFLKSLRGWGNPVQRHGCTKKLVNCNTGLTSVSGWRTKAHLRWELTTEVS